MWWDLKRKSRLLLEYLVAVDAQVARQTGYPALLVDLLWSL